MNLAVILPAPFDGGVVRSSINILRMLMLGAKQHGARLTLSFGYPEEMNTSNWRVEELEAAGVQMRPFRLQSLPASSLEPYFDGPLTPLHSAKVDSYCVFNDGISNFEEADLWLIVSDHLVHIPPPHKPYGVILYDFVHRYVPEILNQARWDAVEQRALLLQSAAFVVTTTHQTKRDAVSYVGCRPENVHVFPIEFDPLAEAVRPAAHHRPPLRQIVWPTILSQHENHEVVLAGLEKFLRRNADFNVVVLGFGTQTLDPEKESINSHPYVVALRNKVAKSSTLRSRVEFPGYVDDEEYQKIVRESMLLLHTSRFDNGSYSVIEAAWLGTPAVSARYLAMEEIAQQFALPLVFFDVPVKDDLVTKLEEAVAGRRQLQQLLPDHRSLSSHSYAHLAPAYWQRFKHVADSVLGVEAA